jgi:hypothetical protein
MKNPLSFDPFHKPQEFNPRDRMKSQGAELHDNSALRYQIVKTIFENRRETFTAQVTLALPDGTISGWREIPNGSHNNATEAVRACDDYHGTKTRVTEIFSVSMTS